MSSLPAVSAALATLPAADDPAWRSWLRPAELAYGVGRRRAAEHLAARWLAKQVIARVLGWPGEVPWLDIEIVRAVQRPPLVVLRGELAAWHRAGELAVPGVSLTHAGGHAAALAWPGAQRTPGMRP